MMARSTRSKQRPDTLMQDRYLAGIDESLLQRAAGPYIWVNRDDFARSLSGPVYPLRADMQATGGFRREGPHADVAAVQTTSSRPCI
jgi:hypothetical protein